MWLFSMTLTVGCDTTSNEGLNINTSVGLNVTSNVVINMTTNVGIHMTTNVGLNMTTNVAMGPMGPMGRIFANVAKIWDVRFLLNSQKISDVPCVLEFYFFFLR